MNFCFIPPLSSFRSLIPGLSFLLYVALPPFLSVSAPCFQIPLSYLQLQHSPNAADKPFCSLPAWVAVSPASVCIGRNCFPVPISEHGLARKQPDTTCWYHKTIASAPRMRFLGHQLLQISLDVSLQLPFIPSHTDSHSSVEYLSKKPKPEKCTSHISLAWFGNDLGALASTSLFVKWDKDVRSPAYPASNVLCSD